MEKAIQNLNYVLGALNSINVQGKTNLSNLVGSIGLIEQTVQELKQLAEAEANKSDKPAEEQE